MHSVNFRPLALATLFALGTQGGASAQAPPPQPAAASASQGPVILIAPATQGPAAPAAPATVCNLPIPALTALPHEGSAPAIDQPAKDFTFKFAVGSTF